MLKLLCLTVFVAGALAIQFDEASIPQSSSDERIFGGNNATIGQFPHQASLRLANVGRHFCGGVIIAERFILSAAICTQKAQSIPSNVLVIVGALRISTGGIRHALDRIVNHPNFTSTRRSHDISVLRTAQRIVFTQHVRAIALPTTDLLATGGFPAFFSGWGQHRVRPICFSEYHLN